MFSCCAEQQVEAGGSWIVMSSILRDIFKCEKHFVYQSNNQTDRYIILLLRALQFECDVQRWLEVRTLNLHIR